MILRDNFYFGDFFHLWAQVIGTFPFFQPKIIQLTPSGQLLIS